MASIRIHSDLYNFKRTIKGFTERQIKSFILAVVSAAAVTILLGYVLEIDYMISLTIGVFFVALPILVAGVFPVCETFVGLPADEMLQRMQDLGSRGNVLTWQGERVEPLKGATSRAYKKKTRKKGAECCQ